MTLPPYAEKHENAMLGSVLRDPRRVIDVLALCRPDECFILRNQHVLTAMAAVAARGEIADMLSVADELEARGRLELVGMQYLSGLIAAAPDVEQTETYARRVASAAYRRRLMQAGDSIKALAEKERDDVALRSAVETALRGADGDTVDTDVADMGALMDAYFSHIEATAHLGAGITGLATGYEDYDWLLDGYQAESLNLLASRPGMGKSAVATCIALNVAKAVRKLRMGSCHLASSRSASRVRCPVHCARLAVLTTAHSSGDTRCGVPARWLALRQGVHTTAPTSQSPCASASLRAMTTCHNCLPMYSP